jgi:ABC-type antimicrobial peptide transport system permease subunit
LAGRDFDPGDVAASQHVAIISESIAKQYFTGRDPIGATIRRGDSDGDALQIIGVASDARYFDLRAPAEPMIYVPLEQWGFFGYLIVVARTAADPEMLTPSVRRALTTLAPGLNIRDLQGIERIIDDRLVRERLLAGLAMLFGGLALSLAAIGLFGVMAYQVTARTAEIGVRMALGATASRAVRMVLSQSIVVVGAGVFIGTPLALGGGHALAAQLYGVSPFHPMTLAGAILVLFATGLLATLVPARRAARVDTILAMRTD